MRPTQPSQHPLAFGRSFFDSSRPVFSRAGPRGPSTKQQEALLHQGHSAILGARPYYILLVILPTLLLCEPAQPKSLDGFAIVLTDACQSEEAAAANNLSHAGLPHSNVSASSLWQHEVMTLNPDTRLVCGIPSHLFAPRPSAPI